MAADVFELVKNCGQFSIGPGRTVRACWQRIRGVLKADIRVIVQREDAPAVATRAGLSLPTARLDELASLVAALQYSRDDVLAEGPIHADQPVGESGGGA